MNRKNWISMAIILAFGILLNVLYFIGMVDDFWSGLGTAFIFVAALRIVRLIKYKNNSQYREKVDTENKDERNRFISTKAWAWAGYFYVLLGAVAVIVLKIVGYDDISVAISYSVCLLMVLYWLSYLFLRKKY